MKKTLTAMIALIVFTVAITPSCVRSSANLDKFLGEWKRIDQPEKQNYTIGIEDDAIIGTVGKDTCAGLYDRHSDVLKFYVLGKAGVVTYSKRNGHLLLNQGKDGEFERVTH